MSRLLPRNALIGTLALLIVGTGIFSFRWSTQSRRTFSSIPVSLDSVSGRPRLTVEVDALFESARRDLYCGPARRSLTSGSVAMTISRELGEGLRVEGGPRWLVVIFRAKGARVQSAIWEFASNDSRRPLTALWAPDGRTLIVSMMKHRMPECIEYDKFSINNDGRLVRMGTVFGCECAGDTHPQYSPCFGVDGTLHSSHWSLNQDDGTLLPTGEMLPFNPSTGPGGMKLRDDRRSSTYTLFVDANADVLALWTGQEPLTVYRGGVALVKPFLLLERDGDWLAALWFQDDDFGDLRLPDLPGSFVTATVASKPRVFTPLGQLDSRTALVWVQDAGGSRILAIRPASL